MNTYAAHDKIYTKDKLIAAQQQLKSMIMNIVSAAKATNKTTVYLITGGNGDPVNGSFMHLFDKNTCDGVKFVVAHVENVRDNGVPDDAYTVVCVDSWGLDDTLAVELSFDAVDGFDAALVLRSSGVWGMYSVLLFDLVANVVDELCG